MDKWIKYAISTADISGIVKELEPKESLPFEFSSYSNNENDKLRSYLTSSTRQYNALLSQVQKELLPNRDKKFTLRDLYTKYQKNPLYKEDKDAPVDSPASALNDLLFDIIDRLVEAELYSDLKSPELSKVRKQLIALFQQQNPKSDSVDAGDPLPRFESLFSSMRGETEEESDYSLSCMDPIKIEKDNIALLVYQALKKPVSEDGK